MTDQSISPEKEFAHDGVWCAAASDLPKVRDLVAAFAKEGEFNAAPNEKFIEFWEVMIREGFGAILVCDDFRAVLGVVALPEPMDGVLTATEVFWYSNPADRGRAALTVFNAFERWSENRKCERVLVSHFAHMQASRLGVFYKKRGYQNLQTQYIKTEQKFSPCQ